MVDGAIGIDAGDNLLIAAALQRNGDVTPIDLPCDSWLAFQMDK